MIRYSYLLIYGIFLGVGLSADAFTVSIVNGMRWPDMKKRKAIIIAGCFACFQALMPMIGWLLTYTMASYFKTIRKILPFISKAFLLYLGIKSVIESNKALSRTRNESLTVCNLLIQAVATSVDALLVGLSLASFTLLSAFLCSLIIALVTFVLCFLGVHWGRFLGLKSAKKSMFISGCILIFIALINL